MNASIVNASILSEARDLLDTLDSGWSADMWTDIEEHADDLGLCSGDIGLLYHHMDGTEIVRSAVCAMLRGIIRSARAQSRKDAQEGV